MQLTLVCTACDDSRCGETFTCLTCGRELNACESKAKGLDGGHDECADCWEARCLPAGWDKELPAKLKMRRAC